MQKRKIAGIFYLAVGVYGLLFSHSLPMGKWTEPGPGVFPLAVSVLLSLWGVLGLISGIKSGAHGKPEVTWREIFGDRGLPLRISLLTAAFIPLLGVAGYLTASILYLFSLLFWVSRFSWRMSLVYAAILGAVSWYGFTRILGIELPAMGFWYL